MRQILRGVTAVVALAPTLAQAGSLNGASLQLSPVTRAQLQAATMIPVTKRAPAATDDSSVGYAVGNLWNVPGLGLWICADATVGKAIWSSVPTGILPLDSVPVVLHGWATRKLRSAYAGAPLAVTPTGGSSTDIPFDNTGNVSLTALALAAGPVLPVGTTAGPQMTTASVTTEYDQTSGTALNMTVPSGAVAPQIAPLFQTAGSPFVGFAGGGMNWITDYTGTTNIQVPRLATAVSAGSACNWQNMTVQLVMRNGAIGNAVDYPFGCSSSGAQPYPLGMAAQNVLDTAPVYGAAGLQAGLNYNFAFQVPSSPSIFGLNASASTFTAFDSDNGQFANTPNTATVTTTAGSVNLTNYVAVTGGSTLQAGDLATGPGIPANDTVTAISGDKQTVALAAAPTVTGSGVPVSFQRGLLAVSTNGSLVLGGDDTTTAGFAVGLNAAIYGPSLTPAQTLALRESLTDTFKLTPQVRDQAILMGASTDAGADGWMTQSPFRYAEASQARPLTMWNMAIAGTQTGGGASNSANALFASMAGQQYRPYAKNVLVLGNGSGVNSLGAGQTPAQTFADWQKWIASARALGPNVRVVAYDLMPHSGIPTDAIRQTYNALVTGSANSYDALVDLAGSPMLGNPAILTDRTYTVANGGHHSPYYQALEGQLLGTAISAAASK
jgi:hypothetical protein